MSVVLFGPKRPAEGEPEAYDAPEAAEPAERAPHTNPARLPFIEFSIDNVRIVSEVGENQYDKEQPYTKRLYEEPIIFEIEVTLVAPIADPDIEWTAKFCTGDEQDDQARTRSATLCAKKPHAPSDGPRAAARRCWTQ